MKHAYIIRLAIENTSALPKTANLFGAYRYLTEPNFGSDSDIEVKFDEPDRSYQQLLMDCEANPALTRGLEYKSYVDSDKQVTVFHREIYHSTSEQVEISGLNPEFELIISGADGISIKMLQLEIIELGFHVLRKINGSNALDGRSILEEYENQFA